MNETVYVVMGTTGEYSDRNEWTVCAYRSEDDAKAHVTAAEAWVRKNCQDGRRITGQVRYAVKLRGEWGNPFDPDMMLDYTGTNYWYAQVPVLNETPTAANPMERSDATEEVETP